MKKVRNKRLKRQSKKAAAEELAKELAEWRKELDEIKNYKLKVEYVDHDYWNISAIFWFFNHFVIFELL